MSLLHSFRKCNSFLSFFQDFHPSDIHRIASCGMDNTVKIWSMKGNYNALYFDFNCIYFWGLTYLLFSVEFWPNVERSFTWTDLPSKFPTKYVQFPVRITLMINDPLIMIYLFST